MSSIPGVSNTQSAEPAKQAIADWYDSLCPDDAPLLLLADEHQQAAFVGIVLGGPDHTPMAVYDVDKLVEAEMKQDPQATEEEVYDHISYNVFGSATAERGPLFLRRYSAESE